MNRFIEKIKLFIYEIIFYFVYKVLYYKDFEINTKFNIKARTYIKIERLFSFEKGIYYRVRVPNISYQNKKLITAILTVFANESIGMAKYNICKELLKEKQIKNFHY